MKILALETATEACSAALYRDGRVCERFEVAPRRHAELILPMMTGLLEEAGLTLRELDALAFGRGPGAFTGLRIAAGVAQGTALGAGLAVVPVSTLAALAAEALAQTPVAYAVAALDARMGEVYWGVYRRGEAGPVLVGREQVVDPRQAPLPDDLTEAVAVGHGWSAYGEVLRRRFGDRLRTIWPRRLPRAAWIARLAAGTDPGTQWLPPEQGLPVYLRDQVAHRAKA
ncbi:tRNA threonylcarbamoyladenosine biosynthesis protein TsaB [Methylomarinovum tepidoasis]|uniref:tRNA threonylcarbamoyladenosine biosynthesis protein TsaB n=1 Tax=Methylomarinovum tepidoasis TaxID=2840183 RepID=A0AAU9C1W6_9GAMM|nr:tRNA (adenosine(37)-N6)-threonylcarbamoyltransferase complex dimerization subunit type 1 TsaB [Methylomarinovum sp. IN45]BCX89968.1 tRNA threonylcarbamoyladenosine biosynthesis protein TsaB [Methylomarinovum sp. IN45]